ncbi:MAG: type II secretion system protein GspG [Candidatus Poribacteria bacterium]|nr:type II secretion system protein GspG [Candidatus Poribacteria bacterium]
MTRIQLLILIVLAVVIIALTLPPWLEYRKVLQADSDVDLIATAIRKYFKHTGEYPQELTDLITNPGLDGWKGNYLESVPENPWGGSYQILQHSYKVCIPPNHPRVPAKYQLGGIAEISRVYLEGEEGLKYWW